MKNMKKIIFVGLFSLSLILGVNTINADTNYSSYNAGDKITVNVNASEKQEFYVIEASDSSSDKVVAVTASVIGEAMEYGPGPDTSNPFEGSAIQTKLNELTSTWTNIISKRMLEINEVVPDADLTAFNLISFEEPSYLCNIEESTKYWVSTKSKKISSLIIVPYVWRLTAKNCYLDSTIVAGYDDDSVPKAYLRPVITVSKEYVEDGIVVPEEDKVWKEFIEKFKNSDTVSQFKNDGFTVEFEYGDDYLNVKLIDTENNKSWTTSFKYADGIITYVSNANDENLFIDSNYWIPNTIYVLSEMKGYDADKLISWLSEQNNLTLTSDGIEFNTKEMEITLDTQFATGTLNYDGFTNYKLDIMNGIKTFKVDNDLPSDSDEEITTNPKTGSVMIIGITAIVCILSFGLCLYFTNRDMNNA